MPDPLLYRAADARAALGLGNTRFYELLAAGALDAVKQGARTMVTAESMRRYAESLPKAKFGRGTSQPEQTAA